MLYKLEVVEIKFDLKVAPPYFFRDGRKRILGATGPPPPLVRCPSVQRLAMLHGYGYAYRYREDTDTRIRKFSKKI